MTDDFTFELEQTPACPLCGAKRAAVYLNMHENRVSPSLPITYVKCLDCLFIFHKERMTADTMERYYSGAYRQIVTDSEEPTERNYEDEKRRAEFIMSFVSEKIPEVYRHLDIGSSTGTLMNAMRAVYRCKTFGVEPGVAFRTRSKEIVFKSLDDVKGGATFDLITAIHVVEHTVDPVGFLKQIAGLLAPGGRLVMEVPNVYGRISSALHLSHPVAFSLDTARQAVTDAGFDVRILGTHGVPRDTHIILLAAKGG